MTVGESYSTIKSLNHFSNANFKPILIALSSAAKIEQDPKNITNENKTTPKWSLNTPAPTHARSIASSQFTLNSFEGAQTQEIEPLELWFLLEAPKRYLSFWRCRILPISLEISKAIWDGIWVFPRKTRSFLARHNPGKATTNNTLALDSWSRGGLREIEG